MRDDEIDEDREYFPPDDPTAALERLDAGFEDVGDEQPSPLTRRQIEVLIDQVITDELERLEHRKKAT